MCFGAAFLAKSENIFIANNLFISFFNFFNSEILEFRQAFEIMLFVDELNL